MVTWCQRDNILSHSHITPLHSSITQVDNGRYYIQYLLLKRNCQLHRSGMDHTASIRHHLLSYPRPHNHDVLASVIRNSHMAISELVLGLLALVVGATCKPHLWVLPMAPYGLSTYFALRNLRIFSGSSPEFVFEA